MKKWVLLTVFSLIIAGCQATYKATDTARPVSLAGKEITKKEYESLQSVADAMLEDKTDYHLSPRPDTLDTVDKVISAVNPIGALFPLLGGVLGVAGTTTKMARKYRPIVEEGKADAQALYELVRGVMKAGNGNGVSSVTGERLAANLRSSMSDDTKAKLKMLLGKLSHEKVDGV